MLWFKKSTKKEKKPCVVFDLVYGPPQDFDIKFVEVELTFADTRQFHVRVYGSFYQWVSPGSSYSKPTVGTPGVRSALENAQSFIGDVQGQRTYVDDPKNPNVSITGQVIIAHIETLSAPTSYIETHCIRSVIEKTVLK